MATEEDYDRKCQIRKGPVMRTEVQEYAEGTSLTVYRGVYGGSFVGGRALCSDGKVRTLARLATTADTFYSIPAAVKVQGKTVTGFITVVDTLNDSNSVVRFTATKVGRNGQTLVNAGLLP